jgi:hypothetical protein
MKSISFFISFLLDLPSRLCHFSSESQIYSQEFPIVHRTHGREKYGSGKDMDPALRRPLIWVILNKKFQNHREDER